MIPASTIQPIREDALTTVQAVLRQQVNGHHDVLEQTIADCAQETLDANPSGTIANIGSIYVHTLFAEDRVVHGMLQGKPPIYKAGHWASRTEIEMPASPELTPEWGRTLKGGSARLPQVRASGVRGDRCGRGAAVRRRPRPESRHALHR
jgi:hypothetical protein